MIAEKMEKETKEIKEIKITAKEETQDLIQVFELERRPRNH